MSPVVPTGEGDNTPLSFRVPEKLVDRLDAIAKATDNSRTDVILHLLRWALTEYESDHAPEKKKSA